jgi:hypothetical protein
VEHRLFLQLQVEVVVEIMTTVPTTVLREGPVAVMDLPGPIQRAQAYLVKVTLAELDRGVPETSVVVEVAQVRPETQPHWEV